LAQSPNGTQSPRGDWAPPGYPNENHLLQIPRLPALHARGATNRLIARLRREHPEIEIEEVEVLTNLPRALRDGVLMLPTLMVGKKRFHHAPSLDELLKAFEPSSPA